jgi:hypothetical protein
LTDHKRRACLRGVKLTVENRTGRRRGFSNWRRVAVARHAPLWSAPVCSEHSFSVGFEAKEGAGWSEWSRRSQNQLSCRANPSYPAYPASTGSLTVGTGKTREVSRLKSEIRHFLYLGKMMVNVQSQLSSSFLSTSDMLPV